MMILLNGQLYNEKDAVVSAFDHGFLYGMGLFETFRTYGGKPFLLHEHLLRLHKGTQTLQINWNADLAHVEREIQSLLEANQLQDAYIRYTVTAGEDLLGLPLGEYAKPTVIVYMKPLPEPAASLYEVGRPLQLLAQRRNTPEGEVRLKSLHYMNSILAKRELARYAWAEGAEGLMLDGSGWLTEGIVSNLFFVRHGKLYTPSIETGILPGITREYVMRMAHKQGVGVEESFYRWDDLLQAEEIFITNSIQEIVPIHTVFDSQGDSQVVGQGEAGPITRKLIEQYKSKVGKS